RGAGDHAKSELPFLGLDRGASDHCQDRNHAGANRHAADGGLAPEVSKGFKVHAGPCALFRSIVSVVRAGSSDFRAGAGAGGPSHRPREPRPGSVRETSTLASVTGLTAKPAILRRRATLKGLVRRWETRRTNWSR